MPGFMPGIHVFAARKTWMVGPSQTKSGHDGLKMTSENQE
jgi:hypothetical protein